MYFAMPKGKKGIKFDNQLEQCFHVDLVPLLDLK